MKPMMPERMSWLRTRYSARCMPLSVKPRITVRCRYMPRFIQARYRRSTSRRCTPNSSRLPVNQKITSLLLR